MSEKKAQLVTTDSQGERYALTGMRWAGAFPEFVIAYCDEKSLPGLIAEPRVIGIFAGSREAIAAVVRTSSSGVADSKNAREKVAWWCEDASVVSETPGCARYSLRLTEARRIAYASLQHLVAAAVVVLYSKSIIRSRTSSVYGQLASIRIFSLPLRN